MKERIVDDPLLDRGLGRHLAAGAVLLVLLAAAFPTYRVVEAGRRARTLAGRNEAEVILGRQLWAANCAECHGDSGEGEDAPALNAKEFFAEATQQRIHQIIQVGVPGSDMDAWWNEFGGPLTDQQIRGLVAYILSWAATAPSRPDWRTP